MMYGNSSMTTLYVQVAPESLAGTWRSIWKSAETTMRSTLSPGVQSHLAQTRCAACCSLYLHENMQSVSYGGVHQLTLCVQIKGLSLDLQSRDKVIETVKSELQNVTHVW